MHLKSDFKPNILWENIVLIIHLKISWRWFIARCKKKTSWGSFKWVEWWNSLFIKSLLLDLFLLFSSSVFEFSTTDYFCMLLFYKKCPPVTFFIVTEVVGFHSEHFLLQFSVEILLCRKSCGSSQRSFYYLWARFTVLIMLVRWQIVVVLNLSSWYSLGVICSCTFMGGGASEAASEFPSTGISLPMSNSLPRKMTHSFNKHLLSVF